MELSQTTKKIIKYIAIVAIAATQIIVTVAVLNANPPTVIIAVVLSSWIAGYAFMHEIYNYDFGEINPLLVMS